MRKWNPVDGVITYRRYVCLYGLRNLDRLLNISASCGNSLPNAACKQKCNNNTSVIRTSALNCTVSFQTNGRRHHRHARCYMLHQNSKLDTVYTDNKICHLTRQKKTQKTRKSFPRVVTGEMSPKPIVVSMTSTKQKYSQKCVTNSPSGSGQFSHGSPLVSNCTQKRMKIQNRAR